MAAMGDRFTLRQLENDPNGATVYISIFVPKEVVRRLADHPS